MPCPICGGRHGWWVDQHGRRIVGLIRPDQTMTRWHECEACIGGIASCCDAAGSQQPEPEKWSDDGHKT